VLGVLVDADNELFPALDRLLVPESRILDLALDEALLDRLDGAPELVYPLDQLPGSLLELGGQSLDEIRTAEGISGVGPAGLVREDLLRPQRDLRGALGRKRQRLVERVRVDRLSAAADRRQRLDRDADDVVLGLLRRQRRASGLGVEAEGLRTRVRGAETVAHDPRPEPARGAELRDLLEEVVMRVEEEREPLAELVRRKTSCDRGLRVGDAVRERECELLDRRRSGLANVVPRDRDRVEARQALVAVREQVGRDPHRRLGREDVVAPSAVLLQHVVLHGAPERVAADALLLRDELIEEEQKRGRRVDRHRRRDLPERDAVEEELHVGDRVDRDAGTPYLADGPGVV
jgi:hypothetical protein